MHRLTPVSPLGYPEPRMETAGGFTIREATDRAMASVAARSGYAAAVRKTLSRIIGKPAPDAGRHAGGAMDAFWSAPDQWMLSAPYDEHPDIVADLVPEFGDKASLTEQTDGWCRFSVEGPDIERLCALLCNIDTRAFAPGSAARTSIEHMGCFVLRTGGSSIQIIGPRSSAGSLRHALSAAALSAGF